MVFLEINHMNKATFLLFLLASLNGTEKPVCQICQAFKLFHGRFIGFSIIPWHIIRFLFLIHPSVMFAGILVF